MPTPSRVRVEFVVAVRPRPRPHWGTVAFPMLNFRRREKSFAQYRSLDAIALGLGDP
jgi:hypothetical protein